MDYYYPKLYLDNNSVMYVMVVGVDLWMHSYICRSRYLLAFISLIGVRVGSRKRMSGSTGIAVGVKQWKEELVYGIIVGDPHWGDFQRL